MSDRLHSHLSLGFHPDCPACDQLARDMQVAAGLIEENPAGKASQVSALACV